MPIIDYTKLTEPELRSARVHLQRLMTLFHRADREGAYQIFRVECEAITEEINLRHQTTQEMPAIRV